MITATFRPLKDTFISKDSVTVAYQCNGESILRPERFLIYYGIFRPTDTIPTPELIAKWVIKPHKSYINHE